MNSQFSGGNYSNFGGSGPQFQSFNPGNQSFSTLFQPKSSQNQGQSSRPTCQICGKNGHSTLNCYHRMDFAYQGRHAPAKLASMVDNAAQVQASNSWPTNTGCSNHVTPNLSQLSLH